MTGGVSEIVRKLLADALHEPRLCTHAFGLGSRLEGRKSTGALRLHVFKHLAHVGEANIGSVKRKECGGGKGDGDETCAVLFGQRHGERDAGLGRFRAVGIDENILETHAPYSLPS